MGLFNSMAGKKPAQQDETLPSAAGPRESSRSKAVPVDATAVQADADAVPVDGEADGTKSGKPGFLRSHFGNPEAEEVYGTANDYETEEQQIAEEKVSANQSLWYIGAFTVLVFLGYLFFT